MSYLQQNNFFGNFLRHIVSWLPIRSKNETDADLNFDLEDPSFF